MRLFAQDLTTDTLQHIAARGLSEAGGPKPLLLRVLVDLFVRRPTHSDDEIQHFAEIAYTVLPGATAEEIDHAAMRLARHPSAPGDVIDLLAQRAGDGALTLLASSRRLATPLLHHAAAQGSKNKALAIAGRDDLDSETIERLIARNDADILLRLVQNQSVPLAPHLLPRLVVLAHQHSALAASLTQRLPHQQACWSLFLSAHRAERVIMLGAAKKLIPTTPISPVDAEALTQLVACAAQNLEHFLAKLAQTLACSQDLARAIVADRGDEPLLLALVAMGADASMIMSILTRLKPDLTQGQIIWRQALAKSLPRAAAQAILSAMMGQDQAPSLSAAPVITRSA